MPRCLSTLREAFETYVAAGITAPRTRRSYQDALTHWERNTTNPAVNTIDDTVVAEFRARLINRELGPATINKIWRTLRPIVRRLGPKHPAHPERVGLLDREPYFAPLQTTRRQPRIVGSVEFESLYDACSVAEWPQDLDAVELWRAALLAWRETGARCWEVWGETEGCGWLWENLSHAGTRRRLPGRGWIRSRRNAIRFHSGTRRGWTTVELSKRLKAHLDALWHAGRRIFPATKCRSDFYDQWRCIVDRAAETVPSVRGLMPDDLRTRTPTKLVWTLRTIAAPRPAHAQPAPPDVPRRKRKRSRRSAVRRRAAAKSGCAPTVATVPPAAHPLPARNNGPRCRVCGGDMIIGGKEPGRIEWFCKAAMQRTEPFGSAADKPRAEHWQRAKFIQTVSQEMSARRGDGSSANS